MSDREHRRARAVDRSRERRERMGLTLDQARWNAWIRPVRFGRRARLEAES